MRHTYVNARHVGWTCPDCGYGNIDSYVHTATPLCGGCEAVVHWDRILTDGEHRDAGEARRLFHDLQYGATDESH